jgi:hypothetical protein
MKRIVDGLAAKGIAMEINNRRRIPNAAFIRVARQHELVVPQHLGRAGRALRGFCYPRRGTTTSEETT